MEPNSIAEAGYQSIYGKSLTNQHIDAKITDAWDSDIDKLSFNDSTLQEDFGNKGGGLYPIKIALCTHAATFSGNLHYAVTPAGSLGCTTTVSSLSANGTATPDQRQPVQTIQVGGGCSSVKLTAHRTGTLTTMTPKIEEIASPWGFEYLEQFSEYYRGYAPEDYMNDRDFFVRTGLLAEEGEEAKEEYKKNLEFLTNLGLLRLYSGDSSSGGSIAYSPTGSVNLADLNDPNSDLYILSHVIAAEAGDNKLDELMVGSVFVNRVYSDRFPNTYMEVLTAKNQYACYTDGHYQSAEPTESEIASAIQVMSGQFTIPANVTGQSAKVQGIVYKRNDNGKLNPHYYCTMGMEPISNVDRYGRPAPDASQLAAMAEQLSGATPDSAGATASTSLDLATTAFVGDSLTVGMNQTNNLSGQGALVIAKVGNQISDALTAVKNSVSLDSHIKTVYVTIGTNSCLASDDAFRDQYQQLLAAIETKTSGARIILTTMPPMRNNTSWNASNEAINQKNTIISEIASSHGYSILDIHSMLVDTDGQLKREYSSDGLHLKSAGYQLWFDKIKLGITTSEIKPSNPSNDYQIKRGEINVYSRYKLYEISNFNVLNAINMQAKVVQTDESFLDTLAKFFGGIVNFFAPKPGADPSEPIYSYQYEAPYANYDIKSTVYHSIAFSDQTLFSTAAKKADDAAESEDGLMFLFVGANESVSNGSLTGTNFHSVPGVGTTVDGMISPTDTYYAPLNSYTSTNGYMEVSTPLGTDVLAVADGTITAVNTDEADPKGKYVTMETTLNGIRYTITYGYLETIAVVANSNVSKGDLIGTSGTRSDGTAALYLSVEKDGEKVNPSTIFYQSSFTYGGGFGGNLYNADGSVNEVAIDQLYQELSARIQSGRNGGSYGTYHDPATNPFQTLQCTWWAWGRALEYLHASGYNISAQDFRASIHGNGGKYSENNRIHGRFKYGSIPKPNSLVCYPGNPGHVAYVEAVDYVNKCYYVSQAGSGRWWNEHLYKYPFDFAYKSSTNGQYGRGEFIYLDEPNF